MQSMQKNAMMTESVGNAQKFAGRRGGGTVGRDDLQTIAFKMGVANMQKITVNYDKIAPWESLLGYKFVQK